MSTLFYLSVKYGYIKVVKYLLVSRFALNYVKGALNSECLYWAATWGWTDVAISLKHNGADIYANIEGL